MYMFVSLQFEIISHISRTNLFDFELQGVIPMPQQLNYFKDYLNKLDFTIGKEKRADIIKRAIFVVSAGTNDFISYSTLPLRRQSFSIEGYQGYILQNLRELLQVCFEKCYLFDSVN